MVKYTLDLHDHVFDFSKKNVKSIVDKLFKKKGNIVLGISDHNWNELYSKFLKTLKTLKEYKIDLKNQRLFVSVKNKENDKIWLIKTHEVGTNQGHILLIGYNGEKTHNIKKLLKLAHKEKAIVIANHPLHPHGISYFLYLKLAGRENQSASITKKQLKQKKFIDAVELNSYFPEDWPKVKKFSKKNKIPIVTGSDSHKPSEILRSSFQLENLDFRSPKAFKKSFRKALKKHVKLNPVAHGFEAKYFRAVNIILHILLRKLKII
ncbi:MAG: hypothetical protein ACE5ES_01210 [Candidatus Nanoarchaeia archaeon]